MQERPYGNCVFLNVPFDRSYEPFLRALVFTVHDCGLIARCAREIDNSGQVRAEKIYELIAASQLGIHDLSRTSPDRVHGLPRFNMPLELGLFLGAARFGTARQKRKSCLVLDRDEHRYQKYCSDIAGQDIRAHENRIDKLVESVRNWLSNQLMSRGIQVPGDTSIFARYQEFRRELPALCAKLQLEPRKLTYIEYLELTVGWLDEHPWKVARERRLASGARRQS